MNIINYLLIVTLNFEIMGYSLGQIMVFKLVKLGGCLIKQLNNLK